MTESTRAYKHSIKTVIAELGATQKFITPHSAAHQPPADCHQLRLLDDINDPPTQHPADPLQCNFCSSGRNPDSRCIDSRCSDYILAIRRRRQCPPCNVRFSTTETASLL